MYSYFHLLKLADREFGFFFHCSQCNASSGRPSGGIMGMKKTRVYTSCKMACLNNSRNDLIMSLC